ncbi:exopolysaccharide Pel transporter PelG [Ferrovibrio sp.]|uniref:exopolysaccharide Pel transporter PelG n=1 Tax=Ferrovibrio sp. TaxID=1917215 RepID=UPI00311F514A
MAGIGFVLRRLTRQDDLTGVVVGYVYAALVSSGPFLVTVIAMAAVGLLGDAAGEQPAVATFRLVTIYNFALSLVCCGPFLLVMTRYLADRIYEHKVEEAPGMLIGATAVTLGLQLPLVVWLYFIHADMTLPERLAASVHYFLICGIWLVSVFLSALKDYRAIGYSFAGGMALGFAAAHLLLPDFGAAGLIGGSAIGLAAIFFALTLRVMVEYPYGILRPFAFLRYFPRVWQLAVFGFAYNLTIWCDKLVLWLAPEAETAAIGLVSNPAYDSAMFLANLTTVPVLAVFIIAIETEFFERYQTFYRAIEQHATYREIRANQAAIARTLATAGRSILLLQCIVAALAILASPALFAALGIDARQLGIFRLGTLGSLFQILFVFLTIVLAYFDLRMRLVQVTLLYLGLNAGLSWASLAWGFAWYGYGFFLASLLAFLAALAVVIREVGRLPFLTFVKNNASIR